MDRAFWLERWKNRRLGWHLEEVNPHLLDFWDAMALPEGGRVLVPLCGKSLDMKWLAEQGHSVIGVEVSEQAAREFFDEHGLTPERTEEAGWPCLQAGGVAILCGDFFELTPERLGPVDAVFDRASLIALPPAMRARYGAQLTTLLPHRPPMLLVLLAYPQAEMDGPPFAVEEAEVQALYEPDYTVTSLRDWDVLAESPGFREQGLSRLREKVLQLQSAPRWASDSGPSKREGKG